VSQKLSRSQSLFEQVVKTGVPSGVQAGLLRGIGMPHLIRKKVRPMSNIT